MLKKSAYISEGKFMKKFNRMVAPVFAIPLMLVGCQQGDGNERAENQIKKDTDKIQIVTTFYPMYEFTKNIVGDLAEVKLLIPSSIERLCIFVYPYKTLKSLGKTDMKLFH